MEDQNDIEIMRGEFSGQVIGCTGNKPLREDEIKEIIYKKSGIIGNKDTWQHDQIIIVGQKDFDKDYLKMSFEVGDKFGFICHYMSQEDFINFYQQGSEVYYFINDCRFRDHDGLSFLASLKRGWPYVKVKRLNWEILPPGEHPFQQVSGYYKQLKMNDRSLRIDEERIEIIKELGPQKIYVGTDDFRRYVIFYFPTLRKAVLECPIYGNAIYVIKGDWEYLSQYTKAELLDYFSNEVVRIIHGKNWFFKLKKELGL
jgi:hypothetical protein